MTDRIEEVLPIARRVARDLAFMYPNVEEDEAYGNLSLELMLRQRDYLVMFNNGQRRLIELRLNQVGRAASRVDRLIEMRQSNGYIYDPDYVRLFLPFFFQYEDWLDGPVPDDVSSEWRTGEAVDTAIDIKMAWPRLKLWQQRLIVAREMAVPDTDGNPDWDGVADMVGSTSGESCRIRYYEATHQLTFEMNNSRQRRSSDHEGPGSRTAMSNAQANTKISQQ